MDRARWKAEVKYPERKKRELLKNFCFAALLPVEAGRGKAKGREPTRTVKLGVCAISAATTPPTRQFVPNTSFAVIVQNDRPGVWFA